MRHQHRPVLVIDPQHLLPDPIGVLADDVDHLLVPIEEPPVDGDALLLEAHSESTPEILVLCRFDGWRTIEFLGWETGESIREARTEEREGELVHVLTSSELRPMEEFQMLLLAGPRSLN